MGLRSGADLDLGFEFELGLDLNLGLRSGVDLNFGSGFELGSGTRFVFVPSMAFPISSSFQLLSRGFGGELLDIVGHGGPLGDIRRH